MKCQAITNAPLRNLASCVTSTGIQSFQTSWLCPQISLPSMQSWFVASSQWRTPGEQGYKVSAAKGGWEGRAPTVTPGVFPLPTSLQAETGCHRALSIMSLAILSILASPQWQMSWLQTFKKCASFVHLIRDVGAPHLFWKSTFWPQHFLMFLGNVPLERRIHNCNCVFQKSLRGMENWVLFRSQIYWTIKNKEVTRPYSFCTHSSGNLDQFTSYRYWTSNSIKAGKTKNTSNVFIWNPTKHREQVST